MTTPNSGTDPYRSGHYPAPNGERLRARWTAATCLAAVVLTVPLVYGLYPTLAAATQTFGRALDDRARRPLGDGVARPLDYGSVGPRVATRHSGHYSLRVRLGCCDPTSSGGAQR